MCWTARFNTAAKEREMKAAPVLRKATVQKRSSTPVLIPICVHRVCSLVGSWTGFRWSASLCRFPSWIPDQQREGAASFLLHPDFLMLEASVPSGAASVPADVFLIWSYTRWRNSLSEAQRKASLTEDDLIKHRSWKDQWECQRCIPQERQWERKCVCVCVCVWPCTFIINFGRLGFPVSAGFRRAWCSWWCLEELASPLKDYLCSSSESRCCIQVM